MRIAVFGGAGMVGRFVVDEARRQGHEVTSHSRSSGVDLETGAGVDEALDGVGCAVDVTNVLTVRRTAAMRFFESSAKHLQGAAARHGVEHLVVLSIVGIDRFRSLGYYDAKLTQERRHLDGEVPATVVRATQFHEFGLQVVGRSKVGPVAFVPGLEIQSVAARSVAEVLVDAAAGPPQRARPPDVAGPGPVARLDDQARAALARSGARTRVVAVPVLGPARAPSKDGALLPGADARLVGPTFAAWLDGPDGPG